MFITFSSDSHGNVSYFEDVGKSLLTLMGHSGTVPGALKAEEVSNALTNLQRGLGISQPEEDEDEKEPQIALAKRAVPLISLLQAATKNKNAVLWESSTSPS